MLKHGGVWGLMVLATVGLTTASWANPMQDWDVRVGAGVAYGPAFAGSDKTKTRVLPLIDAEHRDGRYFISTRQGVGMNVVKTDEARAGVALTYVRGRDSDDDSRLRGFDDIDAAAGARVFGSYRVLPALDVTGEVVQELGGAGGLTATAGIGTMVPVHEQVRVRASLRTTYATSQHMDEWYGVSAAQSAASGLARFDASGGMRDVTASVGADYSLTEQLSLNAGVGVGMLLGDAADSPVSKNNVAPSVMMGVSWRF